jgi:hypothetical protein
MPEFLLPPLDRSLPLFAYGLLKPDELGYHRIAALVGRVEPALLRGVRLRIRDGLPLLVDDPDGYVEGVLLFPRSGKEEGFYRAVAAFEPARQYEQFTAIEAQSAAPRQLANVLRGRSPTKGSEELDAPWWSSAHDPLLVEGLGVVRHDAERLLGNGWLPALRRTGAPPTPDLFRRFFQLQAVYLLLWTIAERTAAFVIGPDVNATERLRRLERLPAYREAFTAAGVEAGRPITGLRPAAQHPVGLREDGHGSLADYWYTMRCTVAHRGKAAFRDVELVALAIIGLHDVLRRLLAALSPPIRRAWQASEPEGGSSLWALRPAVLGDDPALPTAGDGVDRLLDVLARYRQGRRRLLAALGCPASNRDPLAEFSERLVAGLLGGTLATSRVQKGHDLMTLAGETVQVRYLANASGGWVNEHTVSFEEHLDRYALVVFEDFDPKAVLVFPREAMGTICAMLAKRHPNQARTLQLTHRNYRQFLTERERFEQLGMKILHP